MKNLQCKGTELLATLSIHADRQNNNGYSHLQVVDLFSGAGGLSLGAARAGFAIRGAVENDPHAIETHKQNFPTTTHLSVSVSEITGKNLREMLGLNNGDLTGIIGGPPCQGFSEIGKRNRDDPRNKLFMDFFRIVSESRPKFFLAENVPRIMDDANSNILNEAFSYVENDYDLISDLTVKASEYGAPTTRTRSFFFGSLKDEIAPLTKNDFAPHGNIKKVFVKDALKGLPDEIDPNWQNEEQSWHHVDEYDSDCYASRLKRHVPVGVGDRVALKRLKKEHLVSGCFGTIHSNEVIERFAETKPGKREPISRTVRLDPNGLCNTLRAGTGRDHGAHQALRPIHPTEDRVITPREAARLQGFPDWFQFHPTKWHSFQQIGNSVSPIVAERILLVVKKSLAS
jgi:DNA (cytosine-5)-methyltransferase 1